MKAIFHIRITALPVLLILVLLTLPKTLSTNAENQPDPDPIVAILDEYDGIIRETMDMWNLPGVAVAVVKDNRVLFLKGYGVRKLNLPEPVDTHTVFRLASVSKTFASTLMGLLVKDGLIHWDDPAIRYVPDLCLKDSSTTLGLTIRHILSHTSGLIPHAYDNLIESNIPFDRVLTELKNADIMGPPGSCYGYQNVLFSLAGDIAAKAAVTSYDKLLSYRLLWPLGMHDASVGWDGLMASPNRATPHIIRRRAWRAAKDKKAYYQMPAAAGVNASISDMSRWLLAQMGQMPHIIPDTVLSDIHTPLVRTPGEIPRYNWNGHLRNAHYGLGWRIFNWHGHRMVFHSGGIEGYLSQVGFMPELGIGVAVLLNSRRTDDILPAFFELLLDQREQTTTRNAGVSDYSQRP